MAGDKEKRELVRKVRDLVQRRYGGNYESAFRDYARKRSRDVTVDRDELMDLLYDADVGNRITRGMWADGIIRELDKDSDGRISWSEFESVMKS